MLIVDKNNWPVEKIKGRPITNFFRFLLHGRRVWGDIDDWNATSNYRQTQRLADRRYREIQELNDRLMISGDE